MSRIIPIANRRYPPANLQGASAGTWRDVVAVSAIALLAPLLPLFLGGRTPFVIAYLADGLLAAVMAAVLVITFWNRARPLASRTEQVLWIGSAVVFSLYLLLQILPVPLLARWLGPYPQAMLDLPGFTPSTWSPNPGATLLGWAVFMALWTVAWVVRTLPSRYLGWLLLAFAGSGLFQALYGLVAQAAGSETILGLWPRLTPQHLSGTFTNRNLFAGYMCLVGPLAIFIWLLPGIPGLARLPKPLRLAGMLLSTGVIALAMLATGARMGVIAGSIALLLSGYLWLYHNIDSVRQKRWSVFGMVLLVCIVLLWYGPTLLLERLIEMGMESSRWNVWGLMFSEFPLRYWISGVGLGGFEAAFKTAKSVELTSWYFDAHNDLLQFLVETGVVGLIFMIIVAAGLWCRRRSTRFRAPVYGGLVAISVIGLVDFSWHMAGTQLIIAAYIGLLLRPDKAS